jgi:hypothetical protein
MSVSDYKPLRPGKPDNFEFEGEQPPMYFQFPCCVCPHRHKAQTCAPCQGCAWMDGPQPAQTLRIRRGAIAESP